MVKEKEKEEPPKKRLSSPLASAQPEDCIIPSCATMEAVCLNVSTLSDFNSLCVLLTSTSVPDSVITVLIDSGFTHCFVDSKFACTHDLPLTSIPPIQLRLFDGTSNGTITQSFQFLVTFDSAETMTVNMFVTPLDSSCSVVLGYDWLTPYNPSIDWVLGSIKFHPHLLESLTLSPTSSAKEAQLLSVHEVLCRLQKHGLYCRPDKCKFSVDSIQYLGFILLKDSLKMDSTKIQTIMDWLEPRKVKDIQYFLGFANFYRCFISNYSKIIVPLTCLTHMGTQWIFTDKVQKSFYAMKSTFTSAPVIRIK